MGPRTVHQCPAQNAKCTHQRQQTLHFDTRPLPSLAPGNVDTLPTHGYGRFTHDIFVRPRPPTPQHANTFTHQHGTQITPTLCTWCHAHSSITTSIEQNLVNYNSHSHSQYIPLLNSFTMDITPDTIFNEPVKVATGNGLAWHDLATRYTPLTKWQINASQKIFKGGGGHTAAPRRHSRYVHCPPSP